MQNNLGSNKKKVRILAISDTHCNHDKIDISDWPEADIFIHAGDFTITSTRQQFENFRKFLLKLPYKHKIVIAGNHDFGLEPDQEKCQSVSIMWGVPDNQIVNSKDQIQKLRSVCTYLCHEFVQVENVKIFGTPHTWIGYNMAFTESGIPKDEIWKKLPQKLDILITHTPPYSILDLSIHKSRVGCRRLLKMVEKIQPKIHIFGHIHQGHGKKVINKTQFYNVCYFDQHYNPKNKPTLIEIEVDI